MFEFYDNFKESTKYHLDAFVKQFRKTHKKLGLSGRHIIDTLNDMTNIFLPEDKLLNSAGIMPVYYWFIRSIDDKKHQLVRKFLIHFEEKRKENRKLIREQPNSDKINVLYVEYDNYNRSTNNEQSHRERFRILSDSFGSWLKSPG